MIQAPQDSFTVSGSNLVFDSALTASDSIDFVVALGDVLGVGTPTDGTITTAKIGNGAVTSAKLDTNIDIAGTLDVTGALTADSGIYLGGTGAANYLDDYEEGTWTPVLVGGTTTTYTSQIGKYTKIGQLVHLYFDIHINAVGNGSTNTVGGIPFATINNDALAVSYWSGLVVSPYFVAFQMGGSGALAVGTTSGTANITNGIGIFGNSSRIIAKRLL